MTSRPWPKTLRGQDLHRGLLQVRGNKVGADAGGVDLFKEVLGHAQVDVAHTLDGQAHAVLARIEHTVLASAVVLKLEKVVAIVQYVHILGLSGINEFHCLFSFINNE